MEAYQSHWPRGRAVSRLERLMYRQERWMYRGSAPNRVAAVLNAVWARVGATRFGRDRLATLVVAGRRTGRPRLVPLIVADLDGGRYLVSMLGERADWVANVRAAGGRAVLRHGEREAIRLVEVDRSHRPPIVRRHLAVAPAARSFVPDVARQDAAAFAAFAQQVPVFRIEPGIASSRPTLTRRGGDTGRSRRRRWALATGALVVVAMIAAVMIGATRPGPPPLALPSSAADAPVGPLDGHWTVSEGSIAGFRIDQVVLGLRADVVGRTGEVTGGVDVADGRLVGATMTVDLTTLEVNGKVPEQVATSLGTAADPTATASLAHPVALPERLAAGTSPVAWTVDGTLEMHGVARDVTIALEARRNGPAIEVAGSIPVVLSDWNVRGPAGYGWLGSLDDRGVAEFSLVLRRAAG
jgi:deazaflavin-dependent oxidoreductase (nitroreductase family)